jgi:hypothetical protein
MQILQRQRSYAGKGPRQGGDEVLPETGQVIVVFIEGKPGHKGAVGRSRKGAHPFGQQRTLTESGGSANQGEPAMQAFF